MRTIALLNKKGLTLVEVIIALTVSLLVFLALMQTALIGIEANTKNAIRDEATRIAEGEMSTARNIRLDSLTSSASNLTRNVKNISQQYSVTRTVNIINTDSKQVTVGVTWQWKGETYSHSVMTIIRRMQ